MMCNGINLQELILNVQSNLWNSCDESGKKNRKKLCYKRVNNPKKFLEKFGHELEIPSTEIRVKVVM